MSLTADLVALIEAESDWHFDTAAIIKRRKIALEELHEELHDDQDNKEPGSEWIPVQTLA